MDKFYIRPQNIRIRPWYRCAMCRAQQEGDRSDHVPFYGGTLEDLQSAVAAYRCTSYAMPVGWSYNGEYSCEKCK
jgi:hypothetical protein